LGVTGLSPEIVNAGPSSVGRAEAAVAAGVIDAVGAAEAAGVAEAVVVIALGPVGVGVAEHAADSAATAPRAATTADARARPAI
jgi:hypothetical protein